MWIQACKIGCVRICNCSLHRSQMSSAQSWNFAQTLLFRHVLNPCYRIWSINHTLASDDHIWELLTTGQLQWGNDTHTKKKLFPCGSTYIVSCFSFSSICVHLSFLSLPHIPFKMHSNLFGTDWFVPNMWKHLASSASDCGQSQHWGMWYSSWSIKA